MIQGLSIKKTYPNDFDKVYPLLLDYDSPYSCEDWKGIFEYQWDGSKDYIGYHLEHDGHVAGFMGLVFSHRLINNITYNFCNITSLIVKPDYRASTILFIRKLMALENYILTGLGPIEESWQLFKKIGFVSFENHYKIIPVWNGLLSKRNRLNSCERPEIMEKVDPENKRILKDHIKKNCSSIVFEKSGHYCVMVYKRVTQKHLKITVNKIIVIYASNLDFLNHHLQAILNIFLEKFGFFTALYLDGRFMLNKKKYFSINKEIYPPRICKGSLDSIHINGLYSESILL